MMKAIFLIQIALLLAIREAVGFLPTVSHSHGPIGTNALLPPLHSTPIREKEDVVQNSQKMNDSETTTKGWTANLMQMFGINGDRKVNHRDSSAVAALAFLSWTLLSTPTMANDLPHTPSSSLSSSSSSRSVSTKSSRTSSSPGLSSTRSSSSISSSASRGKSSPSQAALTPKAATTSSIPSSDSNPSASTGKRVVMSSPKSSSARLNVKPKVAAQTASSNSNTKKAALAGERVSMQMPKSSSARLRPSSSSQSGISPPTKTKKKVEVESPKSNTNTSPPKSASSAKASSGGSTSTPKNSVASPVVKKKDPSSPPLMKETTLSLQKDAPKKKKIVSPSNDRSGDIASKKDGLQKPPTKASNAAEKATASSESTDKNTPRKRSGQRVGGRVAKRSDSRELTPTRSRETIIRNNYIIRDAPPARYYFPPRNIGTAYYYNDYAPPLQRQQAYPLYRRPMCAVSESNQQKVCPLKLNEPIDVLVDPIQGLYVQGSVTFINQETFDFTVTYLSPDGYTIQKTFPAVPQKVL